MTDARKYRIIVAGTRTITKCEEVFPILDSMAMHIGEVVSGCAPGVDSIAELWANNHGIHVQRFPADWKQFGMKAGPIRNAKMAEYADRLIAIWDGKSRGTKDMIERMKTLGKPVWIEGPRKEKQ